MQAQSAKLIGEAIQQNPAFLTLRKIEVGLCTLVFGIAAIKCCPSQSTEPPVLLQAAREIAGTVSSSNNRVFLNSDSLLLNLVRASYLQMQFLHIYQEHAANERCVLWGVFAG